MKPEAGLRRDGAMLVMIAAVARIAPAQSAPSAADSAGIREGALHYIEGWYGGAAQRMEKALHPELAKRIVTTDPARGRSTFSSMSALTLINGTRNGGGKATPAGKRSKEIPRLDVV